MRKPLLKKKLNIRAVIGKKTGSLCPDSEWIFMKAIKEGEIFRARAKIAGKYRTVYVKGLRKYGPNYVPAVSISGLIAAFEPKQKRLYSGRLYFDKIKKKQVLVLKPARKANRVIVPIHMLGIDIMDLERELSKARERTITTLKRLKRIRAVARKTS